MKKGLISKILSGGLAAAVVFGSFSPSVLADRELYEALSDDERTLLKGRMGFFGEQQTLKSFVGTAAKSVSGVQKKQIAAENHLRELYFSLPLAG